MNIGSVIGVRSVVLYLLFSLLNLSFTSANNEGKSKSFLAKNSSSQLKKKEVECSAVRKLNSSSQCSFVQNTSDCHFPQGFFQYNDFIYCTFESQHAGAFVVLAIWLIYLFIGLGVTAEEFFCPCLKTFAKTLRMSDSVAGVTLLALGNGAPDIFSVLVAITTSNQNAAPLAFQELFGSGMFVTTVVVGSIQLKNSFELARRPFLRDVIFYVSAVTWTFIVMHREAIQTAEAVGFIVLYVIYVTLVIAGQAVNRTMRKNRQRLLESEEHIDSTSEEDLNEDLIQQRAHANAWKIITDMEASTDFTHFEPIDKYTIIRHSQQAGKDQALTGQFSPINSETPPGEDIYVNMAEGEDNETWVERITGLNFEEWKSKILFWKIFDVFKVPLAIVFNLTVPVIDVDTPNLRWNKWFIVLQCFTCPLACAAVTGSLFVVLYKTFVVWQIILIISPFLALIIILTTSKNPPRFHAVFAVCGFISSVIWIYALAQEIVNLLMSIGISFGLSNAVLGLTLLAWGNSIGDFISNLAMARNGAPRMAIAACYGGPLLNMVIGVGISCTVSALKHEGYVTLIRGHSQYIISASFLGASLLTALILMPSLRFHTSKVAGILLIILYTAYLTISIINESNLL